MRYLLLMPDAQNAYILLTFLPQDRILDAESAVAILAILGYEVSVEDIRAWRQQELQHSQQPACMRDWIRAQFEQAPTASTERDVWYRLHWEISTVSDANLTLYKSNLVKQMRWLLDDLVARACTLRSIL